MASLRTPDGNFPSGVLLFERTFTFPLDMDLRWLNADRSFSFLGSFEEKCRWIFVIASS